MIIQISDFCQPQGTEGKAPEHVTVVACSAFYFVCPHSAFIRSNLTWNSQFLQFYLKFCKLYIILRPRYK